MEKQLRWLSDPLQAYCWPTISINQSYEIQFLPVMVMLTRFFVPFERIIRFPRLMLTGIARLGINIVRLHLPLCPWAHHHRNRDTGTFSILDIY